MRKVWKTVHLLHFRWHCLEVVRLPRRGSNHSKKIYKNWKRKLQMATWPNHRIFVNSMNLCIKRVLIFIRINLWAWIISADHDKLKNAVAVFLSSYEICNSALCMTLVGKRRTLFGIFCHVLIKRYFYDAFSVAGLFSFRRKCFCFQQIILLYAINNWKTSIMRQNNYFCH